jgi:hypothetical protein
VLEWLENTQLAAWIRTELWGWPMVLTLHVLGTALVVGFVFIISLRSLGLFPLLPYSQLQRLFPVIWIAIIIQFLSGFLLWMTKPAQYDADVAFVLKFLLVVAGIVLTRSFYKTLLREAPAWDGKGAISSHGFTFATTTLLVWGGVIIASRLIAHLGSL